MMFKRSKTPVVAGTLLSTTILAQIAFADDTSCHLIGDVLPSDCDRPNGELVVEIPAGANTELDHGSIQDDAGFVIVVDGESLNSDTRVEDAARKADIALADADLQVRFDGLTAPRRLSLARHEPQSSAAPGDVVTIKSQVNYPAYIARGSVVVYDIGLSGGPKTLMEVPVDANGEVSFKVPDGSDLVVTHRVYDKFGRFDETAAVNLTRPDTRNQGLEETGVDMAVRRGIPEKGGAITVSGSNLRPGSTVQTLGENVRVDPDGGFVIDRVMPSGTYDVDVVVQGDGRHLDITRQVEIPGSDWFYLGVADVTFGRREGSLVGDENYSSGRVQLYANGTTESGYKITAALDTREGELDELFDDLGDRDPRTLFDRLGPDFGYPVFGDDSSFEETAPTSGKVYLKVEKDGNYFVWGNTQARIDGSLYLRNERTLYGASAGWQTKETTSHGEPKASISTYASETEALPQRDVFRGTGGSIYFLSRNDITRGSEIITVQVRDRNTGRVLETRTLAFGRDYSINYIQGTITLTSPLSGSANSGIISDPTDEAEVLLIAQYEFAPIGGGSGEFAYGGRVEGWVTDNLRVGVTATNDKTGTADQEAIGVDLRYRLGDRSHVHLEYAESDGPGFGSRQSLDGGLIFDTITPAMGSGRAFRFETLIDFEDVGASRPGSFSAYFEDRTAGFSTLDYNVISDEQLYGFTLNTQISSNVDLSSAFERYENDLGREDTELYLGLDVAVTNVSTLSFGAEYLDREGGAVNGDRTDFALRYTRALANDSEVYVFGQATLAASGLPDNNRAGLGGTYHWGNGWRIEGEYSDGDLGEAASIRVTHNPDENRSVYFGYELDPARTFDGFGTLSTPLERSHYVVGGQRKINERVSVFGENSYDLFGRQRSLASQHGVEYRAGDYTTYTLAFEYGSVEDPDTDDFDRRGVSFGVNYDDGGDIVASALLEYRIDDGVSPASVRDSETFALKLGARYKIDETQRLLFSMNVVSTDNSQSTALDGNFVDATFGYALRPVDNDRFNMLVQYRYLKDEYGQRIDGTDVLGPQQRSHIYSVDASYDVNNHWTIGGKLGGRISESRADESFAFTNNNAYLGVLNARYHVTHKWDLLAEVRAFEAPDADVSEVGVLLAGYRHVGNNWKVGLGYNFTEFSDDLSDLTLDDRGVFVNIVAKY